MSKQIYISADYSSEDGDTMVTDLIKKWGRDNKHLTDYIDMAEVVSGSISKNNPDCRPCELKKEFNRQINASSLVVFVVGDKTAKRKAGSTCSRNEYQNNNLSCTPYKQNTNGTKNCKVQNTCSVGPNDDVGSINNYSYLKHEFMQAVKKKKKIIIFYNSSRIETSWLPDYMNGYEKYAFPFWLDSSHTNGNYSLLKEAL